MTATTKTSTLQLAVNIPIDMEIRYIDVWPNDPSKDTKNHKGFGPSVALKGLVGGEEVRVYPKGFVNRTIEKLVRFDVIEDGHYEHDPAEHYSIPVKNGKVRLGNMLPKGEKYINFDILSVAPTSNGASPKATPPKIASQSGSNVPDSELPEFLRDAAAQDAAELSAKVGFDLKKISTDLALYQGITEYIIAEIAPIYAKSGVGMSPESATAAAATIFIQAKRNQ